MSAEVVDMTIEEWQEAAIAHGNGNPLDAKIKCPLCGHVATPRQFRELGIDWELGFRNCIGRYTEAKGNLHSKERPIPQPCDWTAGGLFGTLNGGIRVTYEDGSATWVFDFAEAGS